MLRNYEMLLVLVYFSLVGSVFNEEASKNLLDITKLWAKELSAYLVALNECARKHETEKAFATSEDVIIISGTEIRNMISDDINKTMIKTEEAVKRISKHAEELSIYRKPHIFGNSSYNYYNTDEISNDESFSDDPAIIEEVRNQWNCDRPSHLPELQCASDHSDRQKREYDNFNYQQLPANKMMERSTRNPSCRNVSYIERHKHFFDVMRFKSHHKFDVPVNLNYSIIKVMNNIDNRDIEVVNGIRFTEALDQTFKCNFELESKTTFQYFASQSGFIRYYPATKWSKEGYDMTYDFRIRSWYTEALTSPKDIVILVDNSGSIKGNRRLISKVIVNNILDTLTDNDYVNIYTYSNYSAPLVKCFSGTMVQANEENLRLFRELFDEHEDKYVSDIAVGLRVAFPLLMKHRRTRRKGIICNQAIMLITEGLDYEYDADIFKKYNSQKGKNYYGPIRIFTYLLGTDPNDARRMEWIACANMGFYVNISIPEEVQEKVFKYLEVMSRSVNLQHMDAQLTNNAVKVKPEVAWSPQYIHLADRRLSNWLWKKSEGIRQREIFIKLGKDRLKRAGDAVEPNRRHFTASEYHPYKQYETPRKYGFLTTASVPVYDARPEEMSLLGVAAIDLPLEYIKKMTKPYLIGVNGYAFILTNNGYVLLHPHHRIVFGNNILKPTYNRVDLTEVEITTATLKSRQFDSNIIELRDKMVMRKRPGSGKLHVKTPLDDLKRVIINSQLYFWDAVGPFTFVVVLPDKYGHVNVNHPVKKIFEDLLAGLESNENWTIHPEWEYCKHPELQTLMQLLRNLPLHLRKKNVEKYCRCDLTILLLKDLLATKWFTFPLPTHGDIISIFLSTHSGLTRWRKLSNAFPNWNILTLGDKSIDEVWYRRAVEMNYHYDSEMFIYALPFQEITESSDYNNSLVIASHAIFQTGRSEATPVAVVGYQLRLTTLLRKFKKITKSHCQTELNCTLSCESEEYNCYVIDNDGYIILHHNASLLGRSLADVDQILVDQLVKDNVLGSINMFDYQGTCFPPEPEKEDSFYGPGKDVDPKTNCTVDIKCKTIEFLHHSIKKTVPTPCDMEYKMYHILPSFGKMIDKQNTTSFCACPYVAARVNGTNLLFLVQQGNCCPFNESMRSETVVNMYPKEIIYESNTMSMACYIGTHNNYSIRSYKTCILNHKVEYELNNNRTYCKIW